MADAAVGTPIPAPKPVHILTLLILAGLLLFAGLGDMGLTDRDEGSNAEAAREMLETGNWVSPTLNYEPRYEKPALAYWVISLSYALFSVNEFAARLPSAVFGLALILLHYVFLAKLLGARIAFIGAAMLLLNLEVVAGHRMVLTDPELIFFTTVSAYCFWLGFHGTGWQRHWIWGFYIGMALAMLAKGPVGILIPLLGVIPYLTVTRQWPRFRSTGFPILGSLVLLLVAAPWYVAMFAIHGGDYWAAAQANTTGRFANPMEGHGGTIFFFLPILAFGFFPWSGLLPFACVQALKNWKGVWRGTICLTRERELALFAAMWAIGIFLFFSLSATRLPHYLLPLFPGASILTALFWSRLLPSAAPSHEKEGGEAGRLAPTGDPEAHGSSESGEPGEPGEANPPGLSGSLSMLVILGYVFALAVACVPALYSLFQQDIAQNFPMAEKISPGRFPFVLAGIIVLGVTVTRHFAMNPRRRAHAFWVACGLMAGLMLSIILLVIPPLNRYFIAPPQELATIAGLNLGTEGHLVQFGPRRPSLSFYAKRKIVFISPGEDEKFRAIRDSPGRTMIILQAHLQPRLPEPESTYPVLLAHQGFLLLSNEGMVKE